MGKIDELDEWYDSLRPLGAWLSDEIADWVDRSSVATLFGLKTDALDPIFLLAQWEREAPSVMGSLISRALADGHSWNEVAAALGVSRQAAVKRYGVHRRSPALESGDVERPT